MTVRLVLRVGAEGTRAPQSDVRKGVTVHHEPMESISATTLGSSFVLHHSLVVHGLRSPSKVSV